MTAHPDAVPYRRAANAEATVLDQHYEIERLKTALRRIRSLEEKNVPKYAQQIAREALKE